MSLSSALPAAVILECLKVETRPANWAASRDSSSASLKRALREKAGDDVDADREESPEAIDTIEAIDPRLVKGASGIALDS